MSESRVFQKNRTWLFMSGPCQCRVLVCRGTECRGRQLITVLKSSLLFEGSTSLQEQWSVSQLCALTSWGCQGEIKALTILSVHSKFDCLHWLYPDIQYNKTVNTLES